ncbi:cupin domain-containing protein [Streptomyces durocortorensis]|uniref:Cupin domain-containing protein n=1 Tax=Streptomyces durocortorensis TaxID=2811104 RepID=A0ABS2I8J6_9ACTN|nr:cupin domain-containing protein [Streptomyces durocortorensis]MBM7058589.1 cupin domain-containing protein [Streptomyces durocortorensis]
MTRTTTSPSPSAPSLGDARIISTADFVFTPLAGRLTEIATPVSPAVGSTHVTLHVVRIAPGETFSPESSADEENTAVVFDGRGTATVGSRSRSVERSHAAYAPTGQALSLTAVEDVLTVYIWRTPLTPGRLPGTDPEPFSTLWDETTQLRGFGGTGQISPDADRATMNFVFWPGNGSSQLCLHCGIQQPGQTFNVHLHPDSDEAFIAFEGIGQMYLRDRWIDVAAGDVLYAAPGVLHGARNPHTGPDARRFVTCGGPSPYDPALYSAAGLSSDVR